MSVNEKLAAAEEARHQNRIGKSLAGDRFWGLAINAYSKAITLCPHIPSYWMNRAFCHYKRKNWALVEEDCRSAILLDSAIIEAHHMLGAALLQRREYAEGIRELEKALELSRGIYPNINSVKSIRFDLARAKYHSWVVAARKRSRKLHNLRKSLEDVFREAAKADMPTEVPDYFCCAITLDILKDPVVTPYGHTYEKEAIIRHLERNNFDPMTRGPLDRSQLVPNLAVKKAVQAFLDKHGWAYKEHIG